MNEFDEIVFELYSVSDLVDMLADSASCELDDSDYRPEQDRMENALHAVAAQIRRISRELMEYDLVD